MPPAQQAGVARASIEFDLQKLQAAVIGVKSASSQMTNAMNKTGVAAGAAQQKYTSLGQTVRKLQGEMIALTAAAGGLAAVGLRTASNIENATIQLKSMTGSLKDANKLMDQMRAKGREAAVPFEQMIDLAIKLLPQLQGNTEELDRWIDLSRRLSVLNPKEGLSGAAFSIRETLSSKGRDLISLAERFNISRVDFRKALAEEGGDIAAAMDKVLTKMGITEATADELTTTFTAGLSRISDAFNQLLGQAFTPFLDGLTDALERTAAWANELRDANPEILKLSAGIIGLTAVLLPAALLFERMATAATTFAASAAAPILAAIGIGVAASAAVIGGGIALGTGATRAVGYATGDTELQEETFRDTIDRINRVLLEEAIMREDYVRKYGFTENIREQAQFRYQGLVMRREAESGPPPPGITISPRLGPTPVTTPSFFAGGLDANQFEVVQKWQEDLAELEKRFGEQRVQATEQYERQRANVIESYGKTIARESEDWARAQARALEDYQQSIDDVREDAARRERLAEEDFNLKMQDVREDHHKKIQEIEEDFNGRRQDLVEDHQDKILKAAARGDAFAILEENRRFDLQMRKLDREEKKRRSKAEEDEKEREKDQRAAFELRRKRAQEADELRLRDMKDAFDEQQREAEEDRAVRLQRMKDDHQDQLDAMAEAQTLRLEQIEKQEKEARGKLEQEFLKKLAEEDKYTQAYMDELTKREEAQRKAFDRFWDHMLKRILGEKGIPIGEQQQSTGALQVADPFMPTETGDEGGTKPRKRIYTPRFADGGPVHQTGAAFLHAGEYVMNKAVTDSLRAASGGNFNQMDIMRAVSGGGNRSTSLQIAPGAIVVNESQRPGMTGQEIEMAMLNVIRRVA